MKCHYDDQVAHYRCAQTGEYVCLGHSRLDVVSVATRVKRQALPVRQAGPEDCATVRDLAMMYWGETRVDCFDRTFDVVQLPAFLAYGDDEVAGVLSFAIVGNEMIIAMLNVHPEFQGRHTARSLLARAEQEARSRGLSHLVVATSNDDLPALYLYQRWGFVIREVRPGAILAHHGREEAGFAAIPVRDEVRLEKVVGA